MLTLLLVALIESRGGMLVLARESLENVDMEGKSLAMTAKDDRIFLTMEEDNEPEV